MLKWVPPNQLKQSKLVNAEDTSFCTFSKESKGVFQKSTKTNDRRGGLRQESSLSRPQSFTSKLGVVHLFGCLHVAKLSLKLGNARLWVSKRSKDVH